MLHTDIAKLLNGQIMKELYPAYLYLDMENYHSDKGLDGIENWFVRERGEEEKNASDLIKRFGLFGSDAKGLYRLGQELGARVYAAPSLVLG